MICFKNFNPQMNFVKKAKKNHKEFYFIIIIKLFAVYGTPSKKNIFLSANDNIFVFREF